MSGLADVNWERLLRPLRSRRMLDDPFRRQAASAPPPAETPRVLVLQGTPAGHPTLDEEQPPTSGKETFAGLTYWQHILIVFGLVIGAVAAVGIIRRVLRPFTRGLSALERSARPRPDASLSSKGQNNSAVFVDKTPKEGDSDQVWSKPSKIKKRVLFKEAAEEGNPEGGGTNGEQGEADVDRPKKKKRKKRRRKLEKVVSLAGLMTPRGGPGSMEPRKSDVWVEVCNPDVLLKGNSPRGVWSPRELYQTLRHSIRVK